MESVIVIGPGIVIFTGLLVNCCADFQSSTNRNDLFETLLVIVGSVASKAPFLTDLVVKCSKLTPLKNLN